MRINADAKHLVRRPHCYGSGMFITDPNFSIPDPGSASQNLNILTQKWFLSSRKYDPGCSSRIRIMTFYPSRIPDPGVKMAPDRGSETRFGVHPPSSPGAAEPWPSHRRGPWSDGSCCRRGSTWAARPPTGRTVPSG
jgi:hypothetical protein